MDIQTIVAKLKYNDGHFPREALTEAINNQELIVPELLKVIAFTKEHVFEIVEEKNYIGHIFAMFLLAQFREKKAFPIIIDFFSIPGDIPLNISGDVVTEHLGRILASVYDGNDRLVQGLIENKKLNEYVRTAGLECFLVLVAVGIKSRDEVIEYFKELFHGKLKGDYSYVWTALATRCAYLYPEEVYEEIQSAHEEGLIEGFFADFQTIKDILQEGKEKTLDDLRKSRRHTLIENTLYEMQNWACFRNSLKEVKQRKKTGRNKPCPCGSGKKYKKCCLNKDERA